jgi:hypothetical protein
MNDTDGVLGIWGEFYRVMDLLNYRRYWRLVFRVFS